MTKLFETSFRNRDNGPQRANHGKPWEYTHKAILNRMFHAGESLEAMCVMLGRSAAGVLPQLEKAGLIHYDSDASEYYHGRRPEPLHEWAIKYLSMPVEVTHATPPIESTAMTQANTTPAIEVRTKTLIHGVDATTMTDDAIFKVIADKEAEIRNLKNIQATSKKLLARIQSIESEIAALVEFVDGRP